MSGSLSGRAAVGGGRSAPAVSLSKRMAPAVRVLPGLPPYGPLATAFPAEWGRLGREGTVVEFKTERATWVGNFQPGLGGLQFAAVHPNQRDAVVIAAGDLWVVNPKERTAEQLLPAIDTALEVQEPDGWVFSRQGIAFARLGPQGLIWHGGSRGMASINSGSLTARSRDSRGHRSMLSGIHFALNLALEDPREEATSAKTPRAGRCVRHEIGETQPGLQEHATDGATLRRRG
jgi:hypothetical protein